ncbi:hypothetical protein [Geodermatophilus sp. CPCC 206100]|uniref:arsenate reductase/protein-tyrosine-phosphatase family protein n=1 Tax=Geodermatophilus sp. CPCC 206100 TaxID=3020054 RepID=UPI003B006BE3
MFTVLLVCTGNICRSALAERLGRAYLDEVMLDDSHLVRLSSAGVHAVVDSAMHPFSALVLRGLGGDSEGFRARQFVGDMAAQADLTLTMTRRHRREVLESAPRSFARTFTLREAADLARLVEKGPRIGGDGLAERAHRYVRELAAARSRRKSGVEDDIRDPIGLSLQVHEEVGEEIAVALLGVLGGIAALRADAVPSRGRRALTSARRT